jgi:diguanylate cyclase (GGDEF)-like protein
LRQPVARPTLGGTSVFPLPKVPPLERPTRATRAILTTSATEFANAAGSAIAEASAQGAPTTLLAVKVDTNGASPKPDPGHASAVREQVVELIRRNLRGTDVVAHPSAEEMMVLLPGASRDQGNHVAGRLCAAVRNHAFAGNTGDRPKAGITASMGVASTPHHGADVYALSKAAASACEVVSAEGGDGSAIAPVNHGERPARQLEIGRFVGRTEELGTVRRLLDDAIGGSPRAVAVIGEAGSGRGALVRQLEPEVRLRGGSLIIARARNGGVRTPYGIWTQVLLALQRLPDAPNKTWLELMHLDPSIPGSDEERAGSKFRLLEEISEYVRMAARARPLVLVLDEMQWVDAASWDALDHLLTGLERERLLVCLTLRDEPGQSEISERRKALERIDYYHEVRLSRLTRDEVKRWLEAAMHRQEIGRELLAYLYRHTEGNPLFIVQLVRCMAEEGYIRHNGERWEWSAVSELRLPNGLDEIIERRVNRFSKATQDVLCTAAVIGRQFEVEVLLGAAAAREDVVQSAIREAIHADILQANYERGGGGMAFSHVRVADALVASIPPERVAKAHERVARSLKDRPLAATETTLHFDLAGCAPEAYAAALEAAANAESVYSYEAAGEFLHIAARNATSPAELAEVRVRLAHMAETLGRFDEAEELCDLAIEWFSGQGERLRALTLRRMRERARRELGQPARVTLDALRALDEEAKELGSDQERVEILTMESQTYARLGDPQKAEKLAEECVEMAERVGDAALLAGALNRFAITVRNESPKKARQYFERALVLFQRLGDVRGQARVHNNLGIVAQLEMRPDHGRESLTMAMTLARAAGMPDLSGTAALNLGVITQRVGDNERAKELYGDALALFAAVKNSELQLYALYNMANLERETGAYDLGAELYEATSSLAQRIGQSDVEIGAMAGEGLCLLALGKLETVKVHAGEIEQRMSNRQGWFQSREFVEALRVRIAVAEGRVEEAMQIFEAARDQAEEFDLYSVAWLTAACADVLLPHYPEQIMTTVKKYSGQVASLGFTWLISKYQDLQGQPPETVSK